MFIEARSFTSNTSSSQRVNQTEGFQFSYPLPLLSVSRMRCYFSLLCLSWLFSQALAAQRGSVFRMTTPRKVLATSLLTVMPLLSFMHPVRTFADDFPARSSIENIERVMFSLKYMQDDIENKGDPDAVVTQTKFLIRNYRLKDNLQYALTFLSDERREEADKHAKNAVEDLSTIFEYFPEEVDDLTGRRSAPRELLSFGLEAIGAAKKELGAFLAAFPEDIVREVDDQVRREFTSTEAEKVL